MCLANTEALRAILAGARESLEEYSWQNGEAVLRVTKAQIRCLSEDVIALYGACHKSDGSGTAPAPYVGTVNNLCGDPLQTGFSMRADVFCFVSSKAELQLCAALIRFTLTALEDWEFSPRVGFLREEFEGVAAELEWLAHEVQS